MRRFYIDQGLIAGNHVTLSELESRHIATVLRLKPHAPVELFDGTGMVYQGRLETVSKKGVTVQILSRRNEPQPAAPQLMLFQGLLKGNKMDLLLQKATEMGVHCLQPLLTRYSDVRGSSTINLERWNRIMLEACKQSGRTRPMTIEPPRDLSSLSFADFGPKIAFWENEQTVSLEANHLSGPGQIALLLGPEGGFHGQEIELVRAQGFVTVSLGTNILRAETAALAAVAIVQYLAGSFIAPEQKSS